MGYYYYTSNYMLDMPHSVFRLRQNLITTISHSDEIYSRKIGLEELSIFFALDCFASDYNCHCFELQKITLVRSQKVEKIGRYPIFLQKIPR